ncbi:Hint domain-containing protein [Paracoccus nototheniae]|uniref:Hint domain-containing protein n=1 Tax=Paracoccus nototheniae TaxID=2489002 RepID=A0ABW4DVU1_9RHOB|nr:Hint domain-containing protein [Paracoccus nototheniae]
MANSYDVYTGLNVAGLLQVNLGGAANFTNRTLADVPQAGETAAELDVLRDGEIYTTRTGALNTNQTWTYQGNVIDPDSGEAIGFYATSGLNYGIFLPAGSDTPVSTLNINILTGAGLDTDSGWQVTDAEAFCFVQGTMILTPEGERAVETLTIGDLVLTDDGATVPVKWIGRQTVYPRAASARRGDLGLPVRIGAGALGPDLPHRDLDLSGDHAVQLGDYLVNAAALVNGGTIRSLQADALPVCFTYYHIETEDHDLVIAHGLPAETFVDYASRSRFDNHAEYVALYGHEAVIRERPGPRISAARQLPADLRARIGLPDFRAGIDAEHDRLQQMIRAA